MSGSLEQLKSEALRLPTDQRAELAHVLIQSLDEGADADAEAAWDAELARRMEQIARGEAKGHGDETVFTQLRDKHR